MWPCWQTGRDKVLGLACTQYLESKSGIALTRLLTSMHGVNDTESIILNKITSVRLDKFT